MYSSTMCTAPSASAHDARHVSARRRAAREGGHTPTRRASRRYLGGQKASRKAMMPTTAEACSVRASKRILLRSSSEQPSGITFIAYRSDVRLCRTSCGGEGGDEEAGDSEGVALSAVRRGRGPSRLDHAGRAAAELTHHLKRRERQGTLIAAPAAR